MQLVMMQEKNKNKMNYEEKVKGNIHFLAPVHFLFIYLNFCFYLS